MRNNTCWLRPQRILAIARYETHSHMSGRNSLRLLCVAAMLLLPAGLVPTPNLHPQAAVQDFPGDFDREFLGPPLPPRVPVRGPIPPELSWRFENWEQSPFELRPGSPMVVVTPFVTPELRSALDTIDGPSRLEYRDVNFRLKPPGRSLLIVLLAISLLTGPLAETLPGERARRTLEVLLTAGITRGELVGGKWLAWTFSATMGAAVSAFLACSTGVQAPGWWLAGVPLFLGSVVAFGMWLVRLVDDVVGGSAAPMRVLPVAAGAMAGVSYAMSHFSEVAAAAVPIGGPLMVAADLLPGPLAVASATLGSALFIGVALTLTGRDLDRVDTVTAPRRWGALGLSGVAVVLWWLTVAGGSVWTAGPDGIATEMVQPIARTEMVGGVALLACAAITIARDANRRRAAKGPCFCAPVTVAVTLAVAAALAASGSLPVLQATPALPAVGTMLERIRQAALPTAPHAWNGKLLAAGLLSILGQAVLFRSVVAKRLGWVTASVLWGMAVSPWSPWNAMPASLALGALAQGGGWVAALAAHAAWAAAASMPGMVRGQAAALAFQAMALAISLAALKFARGEPSRHHP